MQAATYRLPTIVWVQAIVGGAVVLYISVDSLSKPKAWAWVPWPFIALGTLMVVGGLLLRRCCLQVGPDGITVRGQLTSHSVPWSAVESVSERQSVGKLYPLIKLSTKSLKPMVPSTSKRKRSPDFDEAMATLRLYAGDQTAEPPPPN